MFEPDKSTGLYEKAKGGTEMMYEGLIKRVPQVLLDDVQIICSRVREFEPNKKHILWLHDHWEDPENEHLKNPYSRKKFSKLVFVSNWQFETYHQAYGIQYDESIVLKNCIMPFPEDVEFEKGIFTKAEDAELRLIYHTTPHRGLEILIPVFLHLLQKYPKLHLDVFSSFDIYGWPQRNEPYEPLFKICKEHPNITYHGTKPNEIVRQYLAKAHIFAYPSIWPETSCISVMEAMAAGVAVVCSDLAVLPETTAGNAVMYRYQENKNAHANIFAQALDQTIQRLLTGNLRNLLTFNRNYSTMNYSWKNRIPAWVELLENIK